MKEKKTLIKTLNDETGVEESHLSLNRVIGKRIYTAKQTIIDDGAGYGEEKEEIIQTDITMDCNCISDCECELQNFKNEWEEKWNPPKLCNQVRSLDHFVVQNFGDFLS